MAQTTSGVYAIKNHNTGKVYVGSSIDLARRERVHFRDLKKGVHKSVKLQHSWNKHGAEAFEFTVLEATTADETALRAAEQVWINRMNSVCDGYNVNPIAGNVGRMPKSDEHKRRIGDKRRGATHSAESRALISARARARTPRPLAEATKRKISASNTGKVRTPEMRAHLSDVRAGMKVGPHSPEHCAAISEGKRGKPLSERHKQRIREGLLASRMNRRMNTAGEDEAAARGWAPPKK